MSAVGELEAFVLDSMRSSQDRDLARRALSHELGREPTADQLDTGRGAPGEGKWQITYLLRGPGHAPPGVD